MDTEKLLTAARARSKLMGMTIIDKVVPPVSQEVLDDLERGATVTLKWEPGQFVVTDIGPAEEGLIILEDDRVVNVFQIDSVIASAPPEEMDCE